MCFSISISNGLYKNYSLLFVESSTFLYRERNLRRMIINYNNHTWFKTLSLEFFDIIVAINLQPV